MKNISQTCQRFNLLCTANFTLRINFDKIADGNVPVINRDYKKVILEGTEIPEHLLDSLSSMNRETVSSLQITRPQTQKKGRYRGTKCCRMLARCYLKILKMFHNIKSLELNEVRLSVILKSDIIAAADLPSLENLTFLETHDVNECIYQCLLGATNLTKIIARKVTEATIRCSSFMNLLEQCRTNLKHLEADIFDAGFRKFSMVALEYLFFDFSTKRRSGYSNFWLLDSPMLKTCKIKSHDFPSNEIFNTAPFSDSKILMLSLEDCLTEFVIEDIPKLLKRFTYLEKLMCENTIIWQK